MKIPAFLFTCKTCHGETSIDFNKIEFGKEYACKDCNRPFRISVAQGLSICNQVDNYFGSIPNMEIRFRPSRRPEV